MAELKTLNKKYDYCQLGFKTYWPAETVCQNCQNRNRPLGVRFK